MRLRCPECGSDEITAEAKAFVRQRVRLVEVNKGPRAFPKLAREPFTAEDVQLEDGPVHLTCEGCSYETTVPSDVIDRERA